MIRKTGTKNMKDWHVDVATINGTDIDPNKLYLTSKVLLPSGNEGKLKFSAEFCDFFRIHRPCSKRHPCTCSTDQSGSSGKKRTHDAFLSNMREHNP